MEKVIGIDPSCNREQLTLKKLNILRKCIYDHNHRDEEIVWEMVLHRIDRIYTIEYCIADRNNKLASHLKHWNV